MARRRREDAAQMKAGALTLCDRAGLSPLQLVQFVLSVRKKQENLSRR